MYGRHPHEVEEIELQENYGPDADLCYRAANWDYYPGDEYAANPYQAELDRRMGLDDSPAIRELAAEKEAWAKEVAARPAPVAISSPDVDDDIPF